MRGYRISVREVPETGGQNPPIFERNPACRVNAGDSHDLTVCGAKILIAPVCGEEQPVAGSDFDETSFIYVKRLRLFGCESPFLAVGIANRR